MSLTITRGTALDGLACGAMLFAVLARVQYRRGKNYSRVSLFFDWDRDPHGSWRHPARNHIKAETFRDGLAGCSLSFRLYCRYCASRSCLGSSAWKAAVTSKSLQLLGKISYGLYLSSSHHIRFLQSLRCGLLERWSGYFAVSSLGYATRDLCWSFHRNCIPLQRVF